MHFETEFCVWSLNPHLCLGMHAATKTAKIGSPVTKLRKLQELQNKRFFAVFGKFVVFVRAPLPSAFHLLLTNFSINTQVIIQNRALSLARYLGYQPIITSTDKMAASTRFATVS